MLSVKAACWHQMLPSLGLKYLACLLLTDSHSPRRIVKLHTRIRVAQLLLSAQASFTSRLLIEMNPLVRIQESAMLGCCVQI